MSGEGDKDDKTEDATPKKIFDALERGDAPVSREASSFAALLALAGVFALMTAGQFGPLGAAFALLIENVSAYALNTPADAINVFTGLAAAAGAAIVPIIAALVIAGLAASAAQNTPKFSSERISPDLSRISITKGWKRLFGMRAATEFLKACFKLTAIGAVAAVFIVSAFGAIRDAALHDPQAAPELIRGLMLQSLVMLAVLMGALAGLDLLLTRFHWLQDLRMSRQDVKDELKQSEGDPHLKMRMRSVALSRARRRMMAEVPRATLVIANPTHYAVAMRYKPGETRAPVVLAKGRDLIALKIRAIAEANGVAVVENKALARALHDAVSLDAAIPAEFFKAVAEIIVFLQSRRAAAPKTISWPQS
jgi:flagellar biosynthetic protein FlhB